MISAFHFLRPWWLLALLPLVFLLVYLWRQKSTFSAWDNVCDAHLLPYLIASKGAQRQAFAISWLLLSLFFMIISLAGPTWSRLPVPTYKEIQPRVLVLDMSDQMLMNDLTPDRLTRAKFKLHDLFLHQGAGQFGLVVYTSEPFVVSPLTDDGQTIDALLSSLTLDIMPVEGQQLSSALAQAAQLITEAGFKRGELLVLSGSTPSKEAIYEAKALAKLGIQTSIIPLLGRQTKIDSAFQQLASAGEGRLITFTDTNQDIEQWLAATKTTQHYASNRDDEIPVWRDQGRWFLIPALAFLLPVFRRGWLKGLTA